MENKEKVLKVWPNAMYCESLVGGCFISCGPGTGKELCYLNVEDEEAAWQNAAESLPTQPEQEISICHYHNGPFQEECPLGGKCERVEDWGKPIAKVAAKDHTVHAREMADSKEQEHNPTDLVIIEGSSPRRWTWIGKAGTYQIYFCSDIDPLLAQLAQPSDQPTQKVEEKAAPSGEGLAEKIIRRVVENTVRFMWTRNIEPLASDPDAEFPTEDELVIDALALALGEDIGCLDEKDEDFRESIDLLWLEDQLKPQPDSSSIPEIELELRKMMWLGHGHMGMYGDDGEMQCMECQPFGVVDYKREPLDKVRETFRAVQMQRMTKPSDSSSISTEPTQKEAQGLPKQSMSDKRLAQEIGMKDILESQREAFIELQQWRAWNAAQSHKDNHIVDANDMVDVISKTLSSTSGMSHSECLIWVMTKLGAK